MRHYGTYFDHRYLPQGLALYRSLAAQENDFLLHILCLNTACEKALRGLSLPCACLHPLAELEAADPALAACRQDRALIEYYFTCTPAFLLHLYQRHPEIDVLTYLDADIYFFAAPTLIFAEIADSAVALLPHRFPPELAAQYADRGQYNVSWLSFRRSAEGEAALAWWRERCLEWCYDRREEGRYADQKYLDEFPARFTGVRSISHIGAGAAIWNLGNYRVSRRGDTIMLDETPLIFYHFHGLQRLAPAVYDPRLNFYGVKPNSVVRRAIYGRYLRALWKAEASLGRSAPPLLRRDYQAMPWSARALWRLVRNIARGEHFVCICGCVL